MREIGLGWIGTVLLLAACSGAPAVTIATVPTSTTDSLSDATVMEGQGLFAVGLDSSPVVDARPDSAAYLSPIGVVTDEGTRYMATNGFDDDPALRGILLYQEASGAWWPAGGPIVVDLELEEPGPIGSSLVEGPDGNWLLYGWGSPRGEPESSLIWLPTATDLLGEWTVVPEPVLVRGGVGEWDDGGVLFPAVVVSDAGFSMLYDGFGSLEGDHVGFAHSTEGVRWEKYNDPATVGVFEESDPVFGPDPDGEFDARGIQVARVLPVPGGWVMAYMDVPPGRGPSEVGVATSPDLVNWVRDAITG